eukprot:14563-Heterococcus_DN1.PRE.2
MQLDVVTYSTTITACANSKQLEKALQLFDEYKQTGAALSVDICTAAITACCYSKELQLAFQKFEEMKAAGIQPDVITYTVLIQACNNCQQWQQAAALYEQIEDSVEVRPNRRTYHEAVRAYKQLGSTDKVTELKTKICSDIKQCSKTTAVAADSVEA